MTANTKMTEEERCKEIIRKREAYFKNKLALKNCPTESEGSFAEGFLEGLQAGRAEFSGYFEHSKEISERLANKIAENAKLSAVNEKAKNLILEAVEFGTEPESWNRRAGSFLKLADEMGEK